MTDLLRVVGLRTERRIDPLGIDAPRPRLSWRLESDHRSIMQATYRLQASKRSTFYARDLLWDSGEVSTAEATAVPFDGPPLGSGQSAFWRVRATDTHGCASEWSATASWEAGLLSSAAWTGRWIGYTESGLASQPTDMDRYTPPPYLRRSFLLEAPVRRARAYATALGLYELRINGQRVGSRLLTPGWTDYHTRIEYQSYDVGAMLQLGENVIGAALADGWYTGHIASSGRGKYGDAPAFLGQLNVELATGRVLSIGSDPTWLARPGPALVADLLMGERVDGRAEPLGWDEPGFDGAGWQPAQYRADPGAVLEAATDEGVRVIEHLEPTFVSERAPRRFIVDFGQSIAGHVRLEAAGSRGTTVTVRHAEVLDDAGDLYTVNLRSAESLDTYTFRGEARELFEPRFTYHGFRYADLDGLPNQPGPGQIAAVAISSANTVIGSFECSDELVNAIHRNVVWGLRDNFISIPTDCPQRDERLGWTADIQVFSPSALFICDVGAALEKWLVDLSDAQLPSGAYPDVAPLAGKVGAGNSGWADAGILVPWAVYERTGDPHVLERQYQSMRRYLAYLADDHTDGIRFAGRYGDWLSLGPPTAMDLIGTAYLARSADVFVRIARILARGSDAEKFARLAEGARGAFVRSFVGEDGSIAGETQTGYALALGFDLLPKPLREVAADRLAALVTAAGTHLTTGFLGTPALLPALSDHGHHALACQLAASDTFPGWGFQVRHGATTPWERWNGWTPEAGFADPEMNSFNHYAFGSIADWLHRYVAGLAPTEPGYRRMLVRPQPSSPFSWARAAHDSPYGRHAVAWEREADMLRMTVEVPANTRADVVLQAPARGLLVDGRPAGAEVGVIKIGAKGREETQLSLGSGKYGIEAAGIR